MIKIFLAQMLILMFIAFCFDSFDKKPEKKNQLKI